MGSRRSDVDNGRLHILLTGAVGSSVNYQLFTCAVPRASFVIPDRFDFDPTLCAQMPRLGGLNIIGCIPHRWWWQLARKGKMAEFDQLVLWQENVPLTADFSDNVNLSQFPGCTLEDEAQGDKPGFCPGIIEFPFPNF